VTSAAIYGCSGHRLTAEEKAFFAEARPWGFILFRRNVESPDQLRALTGELRDSIDDPTAPILIDQEGGRVQRLGPPHWPKYPPGDAYLKATNDPLAARELVRLGARLMAHDLRGVLPVIKHMPGHGRAFADSHKDLPVVHADFDTLDAWDFAPFKALSDMPIAMTAHVVFTAVDPNHPATTSKKAVKLMRGHLGFGGLLLSDDLSMQALSGSLTERARAALKAGCDIVLHCNGDLAEMAAVAEGVGKLKGKAADRAETALARIVHTPEPLDEREARDRFDALLSGRLNAAKGPDVGEAQA
jgi:beta-N-acetylhexosaminidase